ncbi:hypothetical protein INT45_006494 [Circinella minor]|uniref:FAD/NAD(P)-binding domain-containing protein n=1 Tax=Circinella minor TaxID=1195481 RepID=A0A8H7S1E6_9FUNG|nr:hypothetical protein INT45_006494 [Circinella minor]
MKNLIILGGGAAGILLAMKLAPKKQKMNINITLIDCKSFFEYTPSLISVLYESTDEQFEKHYNNITMDYKTFLEPLGIHFICGILHDIDKENVICTGSSYSNPWKIPPSCQQNNNTQWKKIDRFNFLRDQREKYKTANKILCIGAGAVGTELVTEIAYRSPEKEIILVNASNNILSGTPQALIQSGERILNQIPSIQLISGEHIEYIHQDHLYKTTQSHTEIKHVDLVYSCIGIQPNTQFLQKSHSDWLDDKNYIRVNEFFQVVKEEEKLIFAIGDVNNIKEPKLWFTAHIQTIHLFHQLERLLFSSHHDINYHPYQGATLSMIISLGPSYGIGSLNDGITIFNGWPFNKNKGSKLAAIIKHIVERITMNDFHSKKIMNDVLYNTHEKSHWIPKFIDKLTHSSPSLTSSSTFSSS